ncbi:putative CCC2-P-type ATPase [Acaromyces ingoldii]|uniref:P-type Cu(+) transporter n=1 Tax=Acaromyces ingoldii TaxID=215250 RepID=A0A316YUZ7_9BASI|nr:putative CCC2-P-type ATPase [Acaromyces ingoldii]PWN93390.1 putative CCC2-P-type ATPase [Acaromyces ingoldii]
MADFDTEKEVMLSKASSSTSKGNAAIMSAQFKIGGMTCGSCVETIERMLRQQDGIHSVTVALLAEKGVVEYDDSKWTPAKIAEEIEDMGFEAEAQAEQREDSQVFKVYGMTCASCTSAVETGIGKMDGVVSCVVSLATEEARVEFDAAKVGLRDIVEAIEDLGFDAVLADDRDSTQLQSLSRVKEVAEWRRAFTFSLCFAVPVFIISMILTKFHSTRALLMWQLLPNLYLQDLLCLALTTPVQFGVGKRFYVTTFKALRHKSATMDVLIVLGTTASYTYSFFSMLFGLFCSGECMKPATFFETSTMLITFVTFGRYLENAAKGKTSEALSKLISLTPSTAVVYTDGKAMTAERKVPSELIQRGDIVKVVPGEKIAADGIVVRGSSTVDESMVTGEAVPITKTPGSAVIGGTVNSLGSFDFEVTRAGKETSLSQIVRLVSDAQTDKAPIQAYADRVAGVFVPSVVLLGAGTFLFWMVTAHVFNLQALPDVFREEGATKTMVCLKLCISVIVVACPCALGLSTPTAVMVGTGVGAQNGILIKGGGPLEASQTIGHIMFDKTGTLTRGKLSVAALCWGDGTISGSSSEQRIVADGDEAKASSPVVFLNDLQQASTAGLSRRQALQAIGAAEGRSEHPLAKATSHFVSASLGQAEGQDPSVSEFESITGQGIRCRVTLSQHIGSTSHRIKVGNLDLVSSTQGADFPAAVHLFREQQEGLGRTVVYATIDGSLTCAMSLADMLKPEARQCIDGLRKMGIRCGIMTGDSQATALAIAKELDIDTSDVHAGMSPNGKRSVIVKLREQAETRASHGGRGLPLTGASRRQKPGIAMVGDGINDSPALAAATLGIAVGTGSEIAIEAASIVLMRDNLLDVAASLHLSRRIFAQIRANFVWATAYNFVFVPLAMGVGLPWGVHLHPMMAGAAMAFSSVSVVLSSLTLKWWARPSWLVRPLDGAEDQMGALEGDDVQSMGFLNDESHTAAKWWTSARTWIGGSARAGNRGVGSSYQSVPVELA